MRYGLCAVLTVISLSAAVSAELPVTDDLAALDAANPVQPLPKIPLGINKKWEDLKTPPTPERVRLGRWLYFDTRISADGTISCATCHKPEHAFSEPTPVSTGIAGKQGARKAPSFINQAWTLYPHFFWDGRADSLEAQAIGPMVNPVEMGMPDHATVVNNIKNAKSYAHYFKESFGDEEITLDRIAKCIADYERTRLSGDSAWDRWQAEPDPDDKQASGEADAYGDEPATTTKPKWTDGRHVTAKVKLGSELFFNKAACNQCHLGDNFTDSLFHNLGVGWDSAKKEFKDIGRYEVSKKDEDKGAFKTPGLRDITKHAPYMHDGSVATLREVVELYNRGGEPNPHLSPKIKPLNLTEDEIDALVAFLEALDGEGYLDTAPAVFPK